MVACPTGVTRRISARRYVTFGAACTACPLRARCTTAKDGRTLRPHPCDAVLRAARGAWGTQPPLRQDYRKYRPNVERVISQIASRGGRRVKLRYLGTGKNNAWLKRRTAALKPAQPHQPGPGPARLDVGARLTANRHQGALAGIAPNLPGLPWREERPPCRPKRPGSLPHRRSLSALFRPNHSLFRALLAASAAGAHPVSLPLHP
jgi:hypothetical protein